jgi:signal transduction histidine kinase
VTLTLADDGVGIHGDAVGGHGLENLRSRAEELGGSFDVTSSLDGGTCLRWTIPLP